MTESSRKKTKFVNGPINAIRLEGEINGIHKIFYNFMDIHYNVENQTKCDDVRSLDIDNYLVENFDKISDSDKIYDFFLEIYPTTILTNPTIFKQKYIWNIHELFKKSFHINTKKNVVGKSNTFPNIRFHYIDIRDYLINSHQILYKLSNLVDLIIKEGFILKNDINDIEIILQSISTQVNIIFDIIYQDKKLFTKKELPPTITTESYEQNIMIDKVKKFIHKIKNDYKHEKPKKIINKIIDTILYDAFAKFRKNYDTFLEEGLPTLKTRASMTSHDISFNKEYGIVVGIPQSNLQLTFYILSNLTDKIFTSCMSIFVILIDLFFMRRFLDKDYVTNGISYTGASHSVNYIYILVKYFDFHITNVSYSKKHIKDVEDEIKKSDHPFHIAELVVPNVVYQCSDMTNFPPQFS